MKWESQRDGGHLDFRNPFHFIAKSNSESALEKLDFAKRKKLSVESETYKFIWETFSAELGISKWKITNLQGLKSKYNIELFVTLLSAAIT